MSGIVPASGDVETLALSRGGVAPAQHVEEIQGMEWQPMGTAPKDETEILGWGQKIGYRAIRFWGGRWELVGGSWLRDEYIEAWMPLPDPPEATL
jgi:hypothetical protein